MSPSQEKAGFPRVHPEAIRQALIAEALQAYEDAGIRGLCAEGRWDLAVDAMRGLDLTSVVKGPDTGEDSGTTAG